MEIFGIDIGGTKCAVIKADGEGRLLATERFATTTCEQTLARIFAVIESLGPGADPIFGIACGSPQDPVRGLIQEPPNLPGWIDVPIVDLLTKRFGGRAWLMNDANSSALAEWLLGAGRGTRHMIFLTFGTGLGGGLILNGQLYAGACFNAGEAGHLRLADEGPVGCFKAGSFEGFCSGGGIAWLAREHARAASTPVAFNPGRIEDITTRHVAEAAYAGDALAGDILRESGRRLGQGLAILIDLINPECIVIGSVYERCQDFLEPAMREVLEREALPASLAACRIVPAELGDQLGDFSAVAVALYHIRQGDSVR